MALFKLFLFPLPEKHSYFGLISSTHFLGFVHTHKYTIHTNTLVIKYHADRKHCSRLSNMASCSSLRHTICSCTLPTEVALTLTHRHQRHRRSGFYEPDVSTSSLTVAQPCLQRWRPDRNRAHKPDSVRLLICASEKQHFIHKYVFAQMQSLCLCS